jgi:hypothetical protein
MKATALEVCTHGCKSALLQTPYFIAVYLVGVKNATGKPLYLPAVVDDFGSLVIVGGPL